jgi:hypothetical protein
MVREERITMSKKSEVAKRMLSIVESYEDGDLTHNFFVSSIFQEAMARKMWGLEKEMTELIVSKIKSEIKTGRI